MSIRRNTAYNLIGAVVPLAASLVTIPIYLDLIGEERYGVLAIAWLLLGYFGLFDVGLGRATAQRIAALRDGSPAERAETLWTALVMNIGLGAVGALVLWPIALFFFAQAFKVEDALRSEMLDCIPWMMLAVPMATVAGVLSGALQGRERFLELNLISVVGTLLFQLMPLLAAAAGQVSLDVLLPVTVLSRLLALLLLAWRCWVTVARGQPMRVTQSRALRLLQFGGWVTVTSFVSPFMVMLDRFVIGVIDGAKSVTYYAIPFGLAQRTTILSGALTSAIFPRLAAMSREDEELLAREAFRALVTVMTPLTVLGVLFIEPFLTWWISPELAKRSTLIGQIILVGFWVNALARIPFAQLQARGRPDIVAKCHIVELVPYLTLLYVGIQLFSLVGAALAFSLRVLVDFLLLAHMAGTLRHSIVPLVSPVSLLFGAVAIGLLCPPASLSWLILIAIQVSVTLLWAWRCAPPALVSLLTGLSGRGRTAGRKPAAEAACE
jgi:O-antigen/teichoic acid export membrane protein